jgi:hypothetical protein
MDKVMKKRGGPRKSTAVQNPTVDVLLENRHVEPLPLITEIPILRKNQRLKIIKQKRSLDVSDKNQIDRTKVHNTKAKSATTIPSEKFTRL